MGSLPSGWFVLNPSGTADDSTALNNAVNGGARTILLGAGTFKLRSTVQILSGGTSIIGAGTGATTVQIDDSLGNIGDGFLIKDVSNTRLREFTLTAGSARTAGNGIQVQGGNTSLPFNSGYLLKDAGCLIENVDMANQFTGIYISNDTNNYNWRTYIRGGRHRDVSVNGHGIWINTALSAGIFGASHFITDWYMAQDLNAANASIRLSGTGDCTITNSEVAGAAYGILMDPAANGFLTSVTVVGSFIDGSGTACLRIAPNASVGKFGAIKFVGTWFAGGGTDVVQIVGAAAKYISFKGCTLYSGGGSPGWCAKVDTASNVDFSDCDFSGATTGGVLFTGSSSAFSVSGSRFTALGVNTGGVTTLPIGIQIDAGCDHYTVTGNDISDASVATKITNTPGTSAARRIVQDNVTA